MSNKNINIEPLNNKGQAHGLWEIYHDDDLAYKGFFQNGKLVGYEEIYWYNGKLGRKKYYL